MFRRIRSALPLATDVVGDMASTQCVYLDRSTRPPAVEQNYIDNLLPYNLDPVQARFVAEMMYLGGVFLPSQADAWLSTHWGPFADAKTDKQRRSCRFRFLQDIFLSQGRRGPIAKSWVLKQDRVEYGRMESRSYYKLVGLEHSRNARAMTEPVVVNRILLLDYIVRHPEFTWYGSSKQKMALFGKDGLNIGDRHLPQRRYESKHAGVPATVAYFVDNLPVGLGDWHVVFLAPGTFDKAPANIRTAVKTHRELFKRLRKRGFRVTVVVPYKKGHDLSFLSSMVEVKPPEVEDRRALMRSFWQVFYSLASDRDFQLSDALGKSVSTPRRLRELVHRAQSSTHAPAAPSELLFHECADLPVYRAN